MTTSPTSRGTRLGWAAALGFAELCVASPSWAEEPAGDAVVYSLSWVRGEGAEECPDTEQLRAEIERRLGRAVFGAPASRSLEAQVSRGTSGFRSHVYLRDGHGRLIGQRDLGSEDALCGPVFSATALASALVIDPEGAIRLEPTLPAAVSRFERGAHEPMADGASERPAARPPIILERRGPRSDLGPKRAASPPVAAPGEGGVALSLAARGFLSAAVLPDPTPGLGLHVEGRCGELWGWSAGALLLAPARAQHLTGTVDVGLSAFSAAAAMSPVRAPRFRLALDAGLLGGALHTAVRRPMATGPAEHLFLALAGGARVHALLTTRWFLEVGGQAAVPLLRRGLFVENHPEPVWRQEPFGGIAFVGTGADFP